MTKTERIRIAPVDVYGTPLRRRTLYIEITKESDGWLTGQELDKEGNWDGVIQIIDTSCIVKRTPVEMNLHYGEFEVGSR